jgi:cytochrome c1
MIATLPSRLARRAVRHAVQCVAGAALAVGLGLAVTPAVASETGHPIERQSWSFSGPLGHFDRAQLQRGYKVFKEVCSTCHSAHYLSFRNLMEAGGPGFSEDEVKALAAGYKIQDGPNDAGEMFERDGKPSDRFPSPYPNPEAARATFGGAYPPDLSLIAKARAVSPGFPGFLVDFVSTYQEGGPDYIFNLLTRYKDEPPHGVTCDDGKYYNEVFTGGPCISMPKPLSDGQVTFDDGAPNSVKDMAHDVTTFLMWAAEPKLEARKQMGLKVLLFLLVFASMLYFVKRKVWADVAH